MRAIVVGAGIGGLSTAIALRRAGAEVTLYERLPELREVGSGLTLWVNAMRVLQKLEAADAVRERGAVVDVIENRRWEGKRYKPLPIGRLRDKYGVPSVGIHRAVLQQTLAEQLPEGTIELSTECKGFEQDDSGVRVEVDGREERADLLVGADGISSTVHGQLFGKPQLRYSGYTCWRSAVDVEHPDLRAGEYIQLYEAGSTFGIFPIGEGRWSWYGTRFTERDGGAGEGAGWKREAQQEFSGWFDAVRAVIDATPEEGFIRQDIYDRVPIETWTRGNVALLGDAAHATTPTLGQGGCMAIEDSLVLARALTEESAVPAALTRYEAERKERANGIVRQAWRHGKLYHGVNPVLRFVRDRVVLSGPEGIAMREVEKLMGYEA
jgi:2-polyprenyl-6-methoxyphenol hydroxylase-like FAD-dependent oxidoreductase